MITMSNQVNCLECGASFKALNNKHLSSHGLTAAAYVLKYPGAKTISESKLAELSARAKLLNSTRSYDGLGAKISATKKTLYASGELVAHNKGKRSSPETIAKLRKALIGRKHSRTGATLTSEQREKISISLRANPLIAARKQERLERIASDRDKHAREIEQQTSEHRALLDVKLSAKLLRIDRLEGGVATLTCTSCQTTFDRSAQCLDDCRLPKLVCRTCNPPARTSIEERELFDFVKSHIADAVSGDRVVLGGKELDVWVPSRKIAFEYDGLYWHSELNRDQPLHMLWKQQHAYSLGVRLIHIYSDEWLTKRAIAESRIKSLLGLQSERVHARACRVELIGNSIKNDFLSSNHLQGADVSKVRYGLFFKGELLAVMTFKRSSFIKGGDGKAWELSRFATKLNHRIAGGASKLMAQFERDHKPEKLISYADRRWSDGRLYHQLGFKLVRASRASYWYLLPGYGERKHRSGFMRHTLGPASEETEWDLMQAKGYDRIWDCGTLSYEKTYAS